MPLGFGSVTGSRAYKRGKRLPIFVSAAVTFSYTGSNQSFTVPIGVSEVQFKLWGAGGGCRHACGGPGGYSEAYMSVTSGEPLVVVVGGTGSWGDTTFGGGGIGYPDGGLGGSSGGGRSAIRTPSGPSLDLLTAGGGGGAGWPGGNYGGTGGGLSASPGTGGGGGGQTGAPGPDCGDGGCAGTGSQHSGGPSTGGWAGGGGGGGWYGGGGGSGSDGNHRGGGGGSGFVGRNGSSALPGTNWGGPSTWQDLSGRTDTVNGRTYRRTRCLQGNFSGDSDYSPGTGAGGENGRVVARYEYSVFDNI